MLQNLAALKIYERIIKTVFPLSREMSQQVMAFFAENVHK